MAEKRTYVFNGTLASFSAGTIVAVGQVDNTDTNPADVVIDNIFATSILSVIGATKTKATNADGAIAKYVKGTGTRGGLKVTFTIPAASILDYIIYADNGIDTISATTVTTGTTLDASIIR